MMAEKPDLLERRQEYIRRQIALDKGVDVQFRGQSPQGSGPVNRDGMPQLPVGQHVVKNWPVLDLGEQPDIALHEWKLHVTGRCENPFTLTWNDFLQLPQVEDVSDFHCVTTWSRYNNHWKGVRFSALAERAVPMPDAKYVLCTGYDFAPGSYIPYTTTLPLTRAMEDDVLPAHPGVGTPPPRQPSEPC